MLTRTQLIRLARQRLAHVPPGNDAALAITAALDDFAEGDRSKYTLDTLTALCALLALTYELPELEQQHPTALTEAINGTLTDAPSLNDTRNGEVSGFTGHRTLTDAVNASYNRPPADAAWDEQIDGNRVFVMVSDFINETEAIPDLKIDGTFPEDEYNGAAYHEVLGLNPADFHPAWDEQIDTRTELRKLKWEVAALHRDVRDLRDR